MAAAQSRDPQERAYALDAITAAYWRPVYKYVRMRRQLEREDAEDFTQDFFSRLLEKDFLASYDPAKGKLRTFLRTCIDRLFQNQTRDANRQKRGGSETHVALDFEEAEHELAASSQSESPEDYFEKEWTRNLFALAVERLRAHCQSAGKPTQFPTEYLWGIGVNYTATDYAVGVEMLVPGNRDTGSHLGVIAQFHLYFDDLFPHSLGAPITKWF